MTHSRASYNIRRTNSLVLIDGECVDIMDDLELMPDSLQSVPFLPSIQVSTTFFPAARLPGAQGLQPDVIILAKSAIPPIVNDMPNKRIVKR